MDASRVKFPYCMGFSVGGGQSRGETAETGLSGLDKKLVFPCCMGFSVGGGQSRGQTAVSSCNNNLTIMASICKYSIACI